MNYTADFKTWEQWRNEGRIVRKGERSSFLNRNQAAVFHISQTVKREQPARKYDFQPGETLIWTNDSKKRQVIFEEYRASGKALVQFEGCGLAVNPNSLSPDKQTQQEELEFLLERLSTQPLHPPTIKRLAEIILENKA